MTNTNYLCIDDHQDNTLEALLAILTDGNLKIHRRTPEKLESQIERIREFIKENSPRAGLLLDLRLDMEPDDDGNRVPYRGPTLAQELRTRMAEHDLPAFPIVLWSVNAKLKRSFDGDESSHDLFDAVFEKDREVSDKPHVVKQQFVSLASGYSKLENVGRCADLVGLSKEDEDSPIYAQFLHELSELFKHSARHEVAHFLLNQLIRRSGLLVTEPMLAARLGVCIKSSVNAWPDLKSIIKATEYSGIFGDAWPRWWWYKVEVWWSGLKDNQPGLRRLTAEERVEFLNATLGLKLVPAAPLKPEYSTRFTTLCAGTSRPIDATDGLRLFSKNIRNWHDTGYVSTHAALERLNIAHWKLDPLEIERLQRLKEL